MNEKEIAVLDVGTTHTRAVVGRFDGTRSTIVGRAFRKTSGIRKCRIVNPGYVGQTVQAALAELEKTTGRSLSLVSVMFGTCDASARAIHETAAVPRTPDEGIGYVTSALKASLRENIERHLPPKDRKVVTCAHRYFTLGAESNPVLDPEGMPASDVTLHALQIHAPNAAFQQLEGVLVEQGIELKADDEPAYLFFPPLAASNAILTRDQKLDGALILDLGGGSTSWCGFLDGVVACAGSIPIGSGHVTADIMEAFHTGSAASAEKLKVESALATTDGISRSERVSVPVEFGRSGRSIPRASLALVTNARMDETLRLVAARISAEVPFSRFGAGIFLIGGGSRLARLPDLVSRIFELPCHLAELVPECQSSLFAGVEPEFASIIGAAVSLGAAMRAHRETHPEPAGPFARAFSWVSRKFSERFHE